MSSEVKLFEVPLSVCEVPTSVLRANVTSSVASLKECFEVYIDRLSLAN